VAIKRYKCTFEINWDASHKESVEVKANTERKAWIMAKQVLMDKYGYSQNDIVAPIIPVGIEKIDC
jgi:hypothetical protein